MSEYTVRATHSSKLRERLPHPVIDTDGHIIEAPFVKIEAMFSSDLGHWDVLDFGDVLHEACEQVEHGLMGEDDFKDFAFTTRSLSRPA